MSAVGFVYFVQAGDHVKIGWSRDPRRRLGSFKVGNAHEVRLLGFVPGTESDEKRLHRVFSAHRVRGEWFKADDDLLAFVTWTCGQSPEGLQASLVECQERVAKAERDAALRGAVHAMEARSLRASRDYKKARAREFSGHASTILRQLREALGAHFDEIHRAIDATDDHDGLADVLRTAACDLYHVMEGQRPGANNSGILGPLFDLWTNLAYLAGDVTDEHGNVEEDDWTPPGASVGPSISG